MSEAKGRKLPKRPVDKRSKEELRAEIHKLTTSNLCLLDAYRIAIMTIDTLNEFPAQSKKMRESIDTIIRLLS